MLSVKAARARILAAVRALPPESLPLANGFRRILAEDLISRTTQPPHDMSQMDGYAVRAADTGKIPARLRIVAEIPAGQSYEGVIGAGECARIFTGAPMPAGTDAVVIQENSERRDQEVEIRETVAPGRYVRPAGLDFRAGTVGLRRGTRLGARALGMAAAMNRPWLSVVRRPRVAILSTGDEIVLPGDPMGPNQIVGSNGIALAAFVEACGGEPLSLGIAPDDRGDLSRLIDSARGADLLVTSGGASVGAHDLVQEVLAEKGMALDFWKIAMRPGKPLMFGHIGDTPVLGLPGNPVSGLVCSLLYLRPALQVMLGLEPDGPEGESVVLAQDLPANDERQDYLRCRLKHDGEGRRLAQVFAKQDSSMMHTLAEADGLLVRPPKAPAARSGEPAEALIFPRDDFLL